MRAAAATQEVTALRKDVNRWRGDNRLILRVDRLELSKNIVRGFQAYALFLRTHPEWHRRVRFLAMLSPSRMDLPEYRAYGRECIAEAEQVNREFGDEDWQPMEVRVKDDYSGALAAYGAVRRAAGEPDLRRDEPRGDGRPAAQSARRRARALAQRGRVLADRASTPSR